MRGNLVACNPWKRASLAERWSLFKRVIKELPPQVHDGRYRKDWNVSRKLRRGTSGWTLKIWVIVSGFKQSKHCVFVSLAAIWIPPPPPLVWQLGSLSFRTQHPTSVEDSARTSSYSDSATKNMMEVTFSKQWIHFLLSERWPPTSTILQPKGNGEERNHRTLQ